MLAPVSQDLWRQVVYGQSPFQVRHGYERQAAQDNTEKSSDLERNRLIFCKPWPLSPWFTAKEAATGQTSFIDTKWPFYPPNGDEKALQMLSFERKMSHTCSI